jgi:hypothetical protein
MIDDVETWTLSFGDAILSGEDDTVFGSSSFQY